MRRLWLMVPLCAVGVLWSGSLMGDDNKPEKQPYTKRVSLPQGYSKLGLTAKQRAEILDIRRKCAAEVQELYEKINNLRDRERIDCANVLTAKQKARLKELLLGSDKDAGDPAPETKKAKKGTVAKEKKKEMEKTAKPVEIKK